MAKEIKAGVEISLRDLFSSGMSKAAGAASGFAQKTLGAIEKIDQAISGTAAKLAAFGLTLSVGAAAKGIIELDHRMTRLGLSVNASAEQVSKLKNAVFDAAQAPDVKIDPTNLLDGIETIISGTNDLKYAEDNIRNVALAIQATGESGDSIGAIFTEFQKFGYTSDQISSLMDDMVAQANEGAFSLGNFAKAAPQIFSVYQNIGTAPENIKKANAALQILNAGMKSPEKAVSAFNAAMGELADPEKQKKLSRLGVRVRDSGGNFRDFNDIMFDIVAKADELGSTDRFNSIFSASTMQAMRSYMAHGERMYESLTNLGDTAGLLQDQSAAMAKTLESNIKNLQTAFYKLADSGLTKPLAALTELLNKFSEDPERVKKTFEGIAIGIGAIAAVKGIAGITRLVGGLSQLKGGKVNITESLSMASAMPVYVTNWGSGSGIPGIGSAGQVQQQVLNQGNPLTTAQTNIKPAQVAGLGIAAGVAVASVKIPQMMNELAEIKQNEDLTDKERGKAKGGAIGDATGSIAGATGGAVAGTLLAALAGGAVAGTAIGTAVPGLGNLVGLLVGAGIGAAGFYFGGKAGRAIGEGIGESLADDGSGQPQKKQKAGSYWGGGFEMPPREQAAQARTPEQNAFDTAMQAWRSQGSQARTPDGAGQPQKKQSAVSYWGGFEMPSMQQPDQIRIPESALPPQMAKTGTIIAPPAKAELEGNATLEVNVNISEERATARVNVKNNSAPLNIHPTGNARLARTLAL